MESTPLFQALPPLKRFRLLQQQQEQQDDEEGNKENAPPPVSMQQLPAKKRKETRDSVLLLPDASVKTPASGSATATTTTTYCLPAKKRVWAQHPDLFSDQPLSLVDLNVPKKAPSFDEETKSPLGITLKESAGTGQEDKEEMVSALHENTQLPEEEEKEEEEEEEEDGILCAVCRSTDGDPTDPIVFCDGCDLMVHATCYGNPLIKGIPEGDWFCAQCLASQSDKKCQSFYTCCLCPTKGGGLKPTTRTGSWAHVVCALLVPEVFFEDPDGREGIDCSKVPKKRWEQKCYVCKSRKGCAVECSEPKCPLAFHVTCGLNEDLCIEYREGRKNKDTIVAGFCKSHTQLWQKQQQTGKFKIVARDRT